MPKHGHRIAECHGGSLDGERFALVDGSTPPKFVRFPAIAAARSDGRPMTVDRVYISTPLADGNVDLEFVGYEVCTDE